MGWRDRDYARWTDDERRRFLGTSTPRRVSASADTERGSLLVPRAGVAVLASAALFAAGHLPKGHPLIPALNFKLPALQRDAPSTPPAGHSAPRPQIRPLRGPKTAQAGFALTFRGTAPAGTVEVDATYGRRPRWVQLTAVPVRPDGTYEAQIRLTQRGLLHLRLLYADGSRSTGSIRVR